MKFEKKKKRLSRNGPKRSETIPKLSEMIRNDSETIRNGPKRLDRLRDRPLIFFCKLGNTYLPLKHGPDRPETLPKCALYDYDRVTYIKSFDAKNKKKFDSLSRNSKCLHLCSGQDPSISGISIFCLNFDRLFMPQKHGCNRLQTMPKRV